MLPQSVIDRFAERRPAEPAVRPAPAPLLVVLRDVEDLDGPVAEAAGRARATGRPLLVAIVLPPQPLTIDAAIHLLHARVAADLEVALSAAVRRRCGPDVTVLRVRGAHGSRRRAAERLARRVVALARRHGAEVHLSRRGSWRPGRVPV